MSGRRYNAQLKIGKHQGIKYSQIIGSRTKYKRSDIKINENKSELTVLINASDITALIASSNYVMKAIKTAESALGAKIPQKAKIA